MLKKLLVFKTAALTALVLTGGLLALASTGTTDLWLKIQFSDHGCSNQYGEIAKTPRLTGGGGQSSPWATDANLFDPDCIRLGLESDQIGMDLDLAKDFRVCLQFSDHNSPFKKIGTKNCTPWATEAVSEQNRWSAWTGDSNLFDPDGGWIFLETRENTSGKKITDARLGVQVSDDQCTTQFSNSYLTKLLSDGGGWTDWASDTNYKDPDCFKAYLEAKLTEPEPIANNDDDDNPLPPPGVCADGIDNDNDGFIDDRDPDCQLNNGLTESTTPVVPNPSCAFTADKTTIIKNVDRATLTWSCQNGTGTPTITNIGSVSNPGSTSVSPTVTTTYTIIYSGRTLGSITIKVNDPIIQEQ